MSTPEEIREDAKRDAIYDARERDAPAPCGCLFLSECCGASLVAATLTGFCPECHDHATFEPSEENTWKFLGTTLYGDDADGNRGVPLRAWECIMCGQEVEVIG